MRLPSWGIGLCAMLLSVPNVIAAIPTQERAALIALYNALDGPNWKHGDYPPPSLTWLGPVGTECTWDLVKCDATGSTVTELDLSYNNVHGPLPKEIGDLSNLEVFIVNGSALTGTLPAEIGRLSKLRILNLGSYDGNSISGPIPRELGQLTNLRELHLYGNRFSGTIPVELASLPNLEVLDLAYNPLQQEEIPPAFLRMPSLRQLSLGSDNLTGSIPSAIALPNIEVLELGGNHLTGPIPGSIGQLRNLNRLDLESNNLSGPLPSELNQLTALTYLALGSNGFEGNLPQLGNLTKMTVLRLHSNRFTGAVPTWIGQMQDLQVLGFGGNPMSGDLPAEFFTLSKLYDFYSPNTRFSGNLADFGKLTALQHLNLNGNDFRGPFPVELTRLDKLVDLDLSQMPLGGSLPAEIRQMKALDSLYLSSTNLTGIPEEIGALTQLTKLYINGNQLTKLPAGFAKLTNLNILLLNNNQFAGRLDVGTFANMNKLYYLDLGGNQFEGPIPPELFSLPAIQTLRLSDNKFSGAMPSVAVAAKMDTLDVTNNRLTALPADLGSLKELTELSADGNEFSGPLPVGLSELTKLKYLRLQGNHFSGSIPDLTRLTALRQLELSGNQFSGPIPDSIGTMNSLTTLYLARNKLSGKIPSNIVNLTNLSSSYGFDIYDNALYTTDPAVKALIDALNPGWDLAQTIAPSDVRVLAQREHSITMAWTPIAFHSGPGGYVISVSNSATGPFSVLTTTPNKETSTFIVDGLDRSTNYFFEVSTVSYPTGGQQNVVLSDRATPVAASTTTGAPAPASIVVLVYPYEIRQRPGAAGTSEYFIENVGDLPANVTLSQKGNLFTQDPAAFTLAGGATQGVTITGKPQQVGAYTDDALIAGDGVPPGLSVRVSMLVTEPPTGTVNALPSANRVDVAAPITDGATGTVQFTNVGNATLQGIVISNVAWIVPPSGLIVIPPGQSQTITFSVDQSKRPDAASPAGAVIGTLSLVYESGAASKTASPDDNTPSVSLTTPVTVVYTITPPTQSVGFPPFAEGEVALFVAGVGYVQGSNNRTFLSDVSVVNAFGVDSPKDIKMYYTPIDLSQGTKVTQVNELQPNQGVTFGNVVKSVFELSNQGTLQIRTRSLDQLFVNANIFNVSDTNGTFGTALPVFRSDRALRAGESIFLTGLRRDAARTTYTNIYIQETSGTTANYAIDFLDLSGNSVGEKRTGSVSPFRLSSIGDGAPVGAVAARITNAADSGGRIVAFATPVDNVSGDFWAIADWSHELGAPLDEPVVIPVAGSVQGNGAFFRTDVAISNRAAGSSTGTFTYFDRSGAIRNRDISLGPRESLVLNDVVATSFPDLGSALGYLEFRPEGGAFSLTSRTFATVPSLQGTYGTGVPTLPRASALRIGQSKIIAGLDVASLQTINAKKPGTFRTNIGLVEIAGQSATIEVTITYADIKQLVAGIRLTTVSYDLTAHQSIIDGIVQRIQASNPNISDLRNVQLKFKVTKGEGAVIVYTSSIDNGTADQILRTD
jgi:Leucine-rich repeat (LRR) protein